MTLRDRHARRADAADVRAVVNILVSAFSSDPTWGWVFPDPARRAAQHERLWTLFAEGALRYPWVWLADGDTATAVWIPPEATELSDEQEADLESFILQLPDTEASRMRQALELFEEAHPYDVPHFYLSLLGTHADHRGHGHGLGLLGDNLHVIDGLGMPAYLESTNPANVPLYERYGFEPIGSFAFGPDGPVVTTMWRPPVPLLADPAKG